MSNQEHAAKTVKVRIAVSVDHTGAWSACGWGPCTSGTEVFHSYTLDSLEPGENRYWLEAELPVPELQVLPASVSEAGQ